ncbi:MAG: heme-degrading domain-containing protein [Clostridiales bacterium]|nr:heme-degrading domain-containing protein [Clostridiales bacterium]
MEHEWKLDNILYQEKTLQFDRFTFENAYEIGSMLYAIAFKRGLPVAIDITRNGHRLYHVALSGSSPDNEAWIERKMNVVNRFSHSSYYMSLYLNSENTTIEEKFLLDEAEFAAHGGSFPIIIRGTGVIGTITVSGLPSEDDHALVIEVLTDYLGGNHEISQH